VVVLFEGFVARGEESPSRRYSHECMSDLGNHTLELLEWNPDRARFTRADPSVEVWCTHGWAKILYR
jgi:hypothetical protein